VRHVVGRQLHGDRAAVRQVLDQAFGGEQLQRLAQRRARYLQLLGELALVQLLARRDAALDDQRAQPLRHRQVQHLAASVDLGLCWHWYTKLRSRNCISPQGR